MSTPSPDSSPPAPTRNARLSADDWAQAALDLIAEQGVSAVAVEPLARRLGVTKGSFYWHFPSRDALLQAALERWEAVEQESIFGSLEQVADSFSLSQSYLSRFYKQETGYTFTQYITLLRLDKAKRLLIETSLPLKDIVVQVGYIDTASFVRKFKACEGVTPGQWRETYKT